MGNPYENVMIIPMSITTLAERLQGWQKDPPQNPHHRDLPRVRTEVTQLSPDHYRFLITLGGRKKGFLQSSYQGFARIEVHGELQAQEKDQTRLTYTYAVDWSSLMPILLVSALGLCLLLSGDTLIGLLFIGWMAGGNLIFEFFLLQNRLEKLPLHIQAVFGL